MSIHSPAQVKDFFEMFRLIFELIKLIRDGVVFIDFDEFRYGFIHAFFPKYLDANKKLTIPPEELEKTIKESFIQIVIDYMLFYSIFFNDEEKQVFIRQFYFTFTFDENESGYVERKKATREKRSQGGYDIKERDNYLVIFDDVTEETFITYDKNVLHLTYDPLLTITKLLKSRLYVHGIFDFLTKAFVDYLYTYKGDGFIQKIVAFGYKKRIYTFDLVNQQANDIEMKYVSGEADVFYYNMLDHFTTLQKEYQIFVDAGDSDYLVIGLNLPPYLTFPHGFILNNHVRDHSDEITYKASPETGGIVTEHQKRKNYFWVDMKRARENFHYSPFNVEDGLVSYVPLVIRTKKDKDKPLPPARLLKGINEKTFHQWQIFNFTVACILSGTDFSKPFKARYNLTKYVFDVENRLPTLNNPPSSDEEEKKYWESFFWVMYYWGIQPFEYRKVIL